MFNWSEMKEHKHKIRALAYRHRRKFLVFNICLVTGMNTALAFFEIYTKEFVVSSYQTAN